VNQPSIYAWKSGGSNNIDWPRTRKSGGSVDPPDPVLPRSMLPAVNKNRCLTIKWCLCIGTNMFILCIQHHFETYKPCTFCRHFKLYVCFVPIMFRICCYELMYINYITVFVILMTSSTWSWWNNALNDIFTNIGCSVCAFLYMCGWCCSQ